MKELNYSDLENPEVRLEIYKKVLYAHEERWADSSFLCDTFQYVLMEDYGFDIYFADVPEYFPEFLAKKPRNRRSTSTWWKKTSQAVRLRVMRKIIKELEDENTKNITKIR